MELLPTEFTKGRFKYIQELRNDKSAIYQQWLEGSFIAYEVIRIKHQKATEFQGIKYQEKEAYPSTNEWGINGFTTKDGKRAKEIFNRISKPKEKNEQRKHKISQG